MSYRGLFRCSVYSFDLQLLSFSSRSSVSFTPSKLHIRFLSALRSFQLSTLPILNLPCQTTGQAFDLLVPVSSTHYCASTSGLSTSPSSRGLYGYLILRGASRLDAFSVYPVPAWLLCYALGNAADSPAAGPSRSSRTKDSSSQISYARAG